MQSLHAIPLEEPQIPDYVKIVVRKFYRNFGPYITPCRWSLSEHRLYVLGEEGYMVALGDSTKNKKYKGVGAWLDYGEEPDANDPPFEPQMLEIIA
jgi:hypothetical protein